LGSPAKKAPSGPFADKLWREALRRAVMKRVEGEQRLDRIAEKVAAAAELGDDKAYREIGDRLDGKATQTIDAKVETTRYVVEVPAPAHSTEEWLAQSSRPN